MPQLVVTNLSKTFPTRSEPLTVLRDVCFELATGENLAVVGPSGSGKSTLLSIIGALDTPTSGGVRLDGIDPFALSDSRQADFRNQRIGFVFQDHHLLPQLTALENVLSPALARNRPRTGQIRRAKQLLGAVGLAERTDHRPAELSGGEKQRVAVARALLNEPALILADEPTGNLDAKTAATIGELLLKMQREENAILITVTHSAELAGMFERRRRLEEGRLVEEPAIP